MNVNKKTVSIAAGAAGIILAVSSCGTDTYEYDVSGKVVGQQIDFDCPKGKGNLALDLVAFESGKHGGSSSKTSKTSKTSKSDSSSSDSGSSSTSKKVSKAPTPSKSSSNPASKGGSKSSSPTPKKTSTPQPKKSANKGVTMNKKPDKPQRLTGGKLPVKKYKYKPRGCETEYEIFVLADDGYTYEQDVAGDHYRACEQARTPKGQKYKLFPACTKG